MVRRNGVGRRYKDKDRGNRRESKGEMEGGAQRRGDGRRSKEKGRWKEEHREGEMEIGAQRRGDGRRRSRERGVEGGAEKGRWKEEQRRGDRRRSTEKYCSITSENNGDNHLISHPMSSKVMQR